MCCVRDIDNLKNKKMTLKICFKFSKNLKFKWVIKIRICNIGTYLTLDI